MEYSGEYNISLLTLAQANAEAQKIFTTIWIKKF